MKDTIDRTYADWQQTHRPLTQAEHQAINARYPGATDERCCMCGNPTGNAGRGNGSIFCDECGEGPFCRDCWNEHDCSKDPDGRATP